MRQLPCLPRLCAELPSTLQVPQQADEWEMINHLLPTPKYPSGAGVSSALRRKKASWSTGDLHALAAAAEAEAAEAEPSGCRELSFASTACSGSGRMLAGPPPPPAAEVAGSLRKVQSYNSLSAAVEASIERSSSSLTRRKSVSVGEHLAPAGSGPLRGPRGSLAPALDSVVEEATSPGAAGAGAAAGGGGSGRRGSTAAMAFRSKSLSVEDAIEALASTPPLSSLQQQTGGATPSGVPLRGPVRGVPRPPAPTVPAAAAAPAPGQMQARPPSPAPVLASSPPPAKPLARAGAEAEVQVMPASADLQQQAPPAALQSPTQQAPALAPTVGEAARKGKRGGFLKHLKGGHKS